MSISEKLILGTKPQHDYELIDSGEGKKLERFGSFVLSRPDPEALWELSKGKDIWQKADAEFIRKRKEVEWKKKKTLPVSWNIHFGGLTMEIRTTSFKHTGLFPEQLSNWQWMEKKITDANPPDGGPVKILNLFGYTGGASLVCAKAGAEVVHVDGSKTAIAWARKNAELSGLSDKPIRWILDDALAFVRREVKRGNRYDGILMDPPAFGHGPKGELWKIEEQLLELLELSKKLLSNKPLFFLINGYASGYSSVAFANNLTPLTEHFGGSIEIGELTIVESKSERLLPAGVFARWGVL